MPLKDHLKSLKSEFNNIKQEVKKFQGQGQGQGYLGQGQQQGYGGQPQQHYSQPGGQYGGQQQYSAQYGQQQFQAPGQTQAYQPPAWQTPNHQQGWNPQHQQGQGQHGGNPQQQQYQPPQGQHQQPGGGYPGSPPPMNQHQQPHQHQQYLPPPGQYQQPPQQHQSFPPPPGQYGSPSPGPAQHYGQQPAPSPQAPQYAAPPAVLYGSHPSTPQPPHQQPQSSPSTYWSAIFNPQTPVSSLFQHKLGNNNGWGNAELEHYTNSSQNSFFTPDSKLVLRAISHPDHPDVSQRYTSARLVSHQTLTHPRGCLTATITAPSAPGIWPAFWLLPREPFTWPADGEIDIAESWNAESTNHTCLHWGHFTPQDSQKHRVVTTPLPGLERRPVKYEFCWDQNESDPNRGGRMVWFIEGSAVMKAHIPPGLKPLRDWTVVINIAMGGNVCGGKTPGEGQWDIVVHELRISGEPDGGWGRVEQGWNQAREGNAM